MATDQPQAQVCPETKPSPEEWQLVPKTLDANMRFTMDGLHLKQPQYAQSLWNEILAAAPTALPSLQEWRGISTAPPTLAERNKPAWLFTPGERLGPNEKDDVRLARPRDWGWATMWMPAQIPTPPSSEKSGGEK